MSELPQKKTEASTLGTAEGPTDTIMPAEQDPATDTDRILTREEVAEQYHISSKTVDRWRKSGLETTEPEGRYRKRVVFQQSAVDRFVVEHRDRVARATSFTKMSAAEKENIIALVREKASSGGGRSTVIAEVAKLTGRSAETIRYTIKRHDAKQPDKAIFGNYAGILNDVQRAAMYEAYKRGASAVDLARRFKKTTTTIYRVITEMRAKRILEQNLEFVPNPVFETAANGDRALEESILSSLPESNGDGKTKTQKPPKEYPPYLASLYEVPLLTREQEVNLFRKMNYLKFCACRLRDGLDPRQANAATMDEIERLLEETTAVKNQIIRANLRLVVSIAKKQVGDGMSFDELVSDGNMSLLRAVEAFDFARGNKFSTYASWAIMKNFARSIPNEHTHHDRFKTGRRDNLFPIIVDPSMPERVEEAHQREVCNIITKLLARLEERERAIVVSRFGLGEAGGPHTLEEVGNALGVTKERVRQLEVRVMGKLRNAVSAEGIELPDEESQRGREQAFFDVPSSGRVGRKHMDE